MTPNDPRLILAARIEVVCDRFEEAWQVAPPCIEDYLDGFTGDDRLALWGVLADVDQDYRARGGRSGEAPDLAQQTVLVAGRTDAPVALTQPRGYEILAEIKEGGMGVVYRATDLALGREVAVKTLKPKYASDPGGARRFLNEARVTAQLQHPAIPPVYEVGTLPDGRPFLAMKLIKGRTLEEVLGPGQPDAAELGQRLAVFEPICQAVAYAHSRGVIHRDLKPSNVMVGAFGEVQVMDWGLAKILSDGPAAAEADGQQQTVISPPPDSDGSQTQDGTTVGTLPFMPPEQAVGLPVDRRADVFGLGSILAVILTGRPPYVGEVLRLARLGQTAECLARLDGCGAEREWVALCKRCLAVDAADRPKDGGEVATEVARLWEEAEKRARSAQVEAVRRRWQVATAAAAALASLAVVAGLALVLWVRMQANERLGETNTQLETTNTQLEATNTQLEDTNTRLGATNSELVRERNRVRLALTAQTAERVESNLKELEQVSRALALMAQESAIEERHLIAWMREVVAKDRRIHGLTLAFEPGQFYHNPLVSSTTIKRRGGPIAAVAALSAPIATEYCLYVVRDRYNENTIEAKYLHPLYRYRTFFWYNDPIRPDGKARWSPAPSVDEDGADVPMVAFVVPIVREKKAVGVATVDVALDDFFKIFRAKSDPLANWRDKFGKEKNGGSYWFVISHTVTLGDPGREITKVQRDKGHRGWNGEPGTGVFVHHPRYRFPLRMKDLSDRPPDFDELARRILKRNKDGGMSEPSDFGTATDPATGKRSTFLFARIPSAEWTFVLVIVEASEGAP